MIFDRVCEIIAEQMDYPREDITMETSIADDLNADSLDIMEVAMAIGDEYDIEIDEDQLEDFVTVGDVVRFVESEASDD